MNAPLRNSEQENPCTPSPLTSKSRSSKLNMATLTTTPISRSEKELCHLDFDWTQGSVYLHTGEGGLAAVYRAINKLSNIPWFKKSVRDIRAFKVEDWSDFTTIVKEE